MTIFKNTVAIILTSMLMVACSSSNNNASGTSEFDGSWLIACNGEPGQYLTNTFVQTGNTAIFTTYGYTDSACTQPNVPAVVVTNTSLTYSGETTTTTLGEASHVALKFEDVTYDGAAPSAEFQAFLLGDGFFDPQYDLMLISEGKLYFGENTADLDGTTPAKRPVALDTVFVGIRQ